AGSDFIESECLQVPASEFATSVKSTIDAVRQVTSIVSKFATAFGDFRLSNAISDCLDLLDLSSDQLSLTLSASQNPKGKDGSTGNVGADMRTWLSAALINQDTCAEGFEGTNSIVQSLVAGSLDQVTSLVNEILSMVRPSPPAPVANPNPKKGGGKGGRKLMKNNTDDTATSFPKWLNHKDRKLLQGNGVAADVVVAADGSGNFTKVMEAISAAPENSTRRYVIYVKKGVYKEYVEISKKKSNIMMVGDGTDVTVISGNRNFIDGWTTYRSATFAVKGRGFIARDLTFENTAGPQKHQAVAFRSDSDLSVLFRCAIRGYQDTLYAHSQRQFYRECQITGTVDFIFGDGTVVFQNCQILARKGLPSQKNTITAQGRKEPTEPSGFAFQFSNISVEPDVLASLNTTVTYLGRPWKLYSRTIIMQSYISNAIRPEGWLEWNGSFALDSLFYGEYMNYGPGAGLGNRVKWPGFHAINDSALANSFTVAQFILGNSWLPPTGVKAWSLNSTSLPAAASSTTTSTTSSLELHQLSSIRSVCMSTPYPDVCFDSLKLSISININPNIIAYLLQSLQTALSEAGKLSGLLYNAGSSGNVVEKQKGTLQDCKELHQITLSSLKKSVSRISSSTSSTSSQKLADARAFLSAALTNKITCLEGLNSASGPLKPTLVKSLNNAYMQVSNSLSILAKPGVPRAGSSASSSSSKNHGRRRLMGAYPTWLSRKDRRILQISSSGDDNDYELTVAADGTGNFTTVTDAINFAPNNSVDRRIFIYVREGVYEENVEIPSYKPNIVLIGDGSDVTVITGNKSVVDGWTTFRSATVAVSGEGFLARDITFENTAGASKHQAVALRINADLAAVYRCAVNGYQDTLYVHSFRQFYRECHISGTIDYIFGNAAVVFQACNIMSRMPMAGQFTVITAQSRDTPNEDTGISMQNCSILATDDLYSNSSSVKNYLGRPWRVYSRVVCLESYIDDFIDPKGWTEWVGDQDLDTLYYGEYENTGPGAGTDNRVAWPGYHVMDYDDASNFTVSKFITGYLYIKVNMAFQDFDQITERRKNEKKQKLKKKITIAVVSTVVLLVLVAAAVCVVVYKTRQGNKSPASPPSKPSQSQNAIKSLCAPTDYKEACESSLQNAVRSNPSASQAKDLPKAAIYVVSVELKKVINQTSKLRLFDSSQKKAAFDDCMVLLNDAIEELNSSVANMDAKDLEKLSSRTPNLNNWLSAVMSYQQTCIDGFPDGEAKAELQKALKNSKQLTSNALAIVSQVSSILSTFQTPTASRRLLETSEPRLPSLGKDGLPSWMSHEDRRMLKADGPKQTPNTTVAKDGSGNFTTISAALAALPQKYQGRYVIYVKEGIYEENVVVTKKMVNVTIYGDGSQKTIVTGSKNYVDGVPTFQTATFAALGERFMAQSIGFRNTAGPEKHQAVALRVQSDHSIFLNCRMEGYQDTLYAQTHRHFYRSCYITGTVDFIFGDAAAIFQNCMIYVRKPMDNQQNIVTAQGRVDRHETTGIVLQNCRILADDKLEPAKSKIKSYLGRPWKEYSRTIVMESEIDDLIHPEGWLPWNGDFALKTLYYAEYNNKGTGANLKARVKWPGYKVIKKEEAMKYTVGPFIQGDSWLKAADIPVHFGLFK
ncbi:hypothetical protein RJ640_009186, partial [Escallonia rubra]